MTAGGLALGVVADAVVGDPARAHPVAAFGRLAKGCERVGYADSRLRGVVHAGLLVGAAVAAGVTVQRAVPRTAAVALGTWTVVGAASLAGEARAIAYALRGGDLDVARQRLPALCGRDPDRLDADGLARAAVESVAENTSDAVVAPLLWGAAAGVPGLLGYRAVNTLDAMVGHRSPRYRRFGWAAARLDDAANWLPARVTAGLACACAPLVGGSPRRAWRVLRRDGARHPSPNAGRCEAAFAGVLGVALGGPVAYEGRIEDRPLLGAGGPVTGPYVDDIDRAVRLSRAVTVAATALAVLLARRRAR